KMSTAGTEGLDRMLHQGADSQQRVHLASRVAADLGVALLGPAAKLAHIAQYQQGAAGESGQHISGSPDGSRIGVVTVVDQADAVAEHLRYASAGDRLQRLQTSNHMFRRNTHSMAGRSCSEGVGDVVSPEQIQLHRHRATRADKNEIHTTAFILTNGLGVEVGFCICQCETQDTLASCPLLPYWPSRIIEIEH